MTALTFLLRLPRLALSICGWRWQNDQCKNKVYISESTKKMHPIMIPPDISPMGELIKKLHFTDRKPSQIPRYCSRG